eukprot:269355-Prymnesium_polylepis.2
MHPRAAPTLSNTTTLSNRPARCAHALIRIRPSPSAAHAFLRLWPRQLHKAMLAEGRDAPLLLYDDSESGTAPFIVPGSARDTRDTSRRAR